MKGIYKIVNKINGKFYLGSSLNIHKRKMRHFYDLLYNKHHSILLQRAYNKYGLENFKFEIIEECDDILNKEQELLNSIDFNNSYNISKFAHGGDRISGNPNEEAIRAKIKESNKLSRPKVEKVYKPRKDTSGENNSNWRGGKTFCNCGCRINSNNATCSNCQDRSGNKNPFFGKSHTESFKANLRKLHLGTYNGNQEKVVIAEGIEYKSLSATATFYKVVPATILNRIKSKNYPNFVYK